MTWSLAILDDGVTNQQQASVGKLTAVEYDYYYDYPDTDDGVPDTHGDKVFASALRVSAAYDVVDLKVASAATGDYSVFAIELALRRILDSSDLQVGAINMSFGGYGYPDQFADELNELAARGVLAVAAAGNYGSESGLETPLYPAALPFVIAVGSHDGTGRPSGFSQNGAGVDILADGEDMPREGVDGTSFAAPRVAATVTNVQAIVHGLTGTVLNVTQMIDVLQLGGAGPRSEPDPADHHTRYFLHDHDRSLDYAWSHFGGTPTRALEYIASYGDLISALGADAGAGQRHFERAGSIEERTISFDALDYIASYADLVAALGANEGAGAAHYITAGSREGRTTTFDGLDYIASYADLIATFGLDERGGAVHYIANGSHEGRTTTFDGLDYIATYGDLIATFGANERAGAIHYITNGSHEGRTTTFDGLEYIASYDDLIAAFGANEPVGATHFITNGSSEGRTTTFDGLEYIASYDDLIAAFGADEHAGAIHYITNGNREERPRDDFDAVQYLANYADLRAAFGTDTTAATVHYISHGKAEGRTDDALGDFLL